MQFDLSAMPLSPIEPHNSCFSSEDETKSYEPWQQIRMPELNSVSEIVFRGC